MVLAVQEALAFKCYANGEDEAGANWLLEAVKKSPSRELFFKYARFFRGDRQWKALEDLAKSVTRELPSEPEVWAAKAEAAFWLKNYDGAVQTVTFATEQKIEAKKIVKWRALAYEELGKAAEAHEDWSRLTGEAEEEGEALAHRAWMRAKLGRWAEVKDDAEQGISRRANPWALALARFALAAEALHGAPPEGEAADPEARKEAAVKHMELAVKTGAVEPADLEKIQETLKPLAGTEEWKKIVESSVEKQKELKEDAKRGGILGVMLDHSGGSVAVVGTYRKTGARKAGLAPGDIILEVDGRRVHHIGDVGSIIAGREPGQAVKVKIERELRPKLKLVQVREITLGARDVFED
jgi:tetratricopeptide (TPR) repeat protein